MGLSKYKSIDLTVIWISVADWIVNKLWNLIIGRSRWVVLIWRVEYLPLVYIMRRTIGCSCWRSWVCDRHNCHSWNENSTNVNGFARVYAFALSWATYQWTAVRRMLRERHADSQLDLDFVQLVAWHQRAPEHRSDRTLEQIFRLNIRYPALQIYRQISNCYG